MDIEVCGRHLSTEAIARVQSTVDADPSLSRRALSRLVCEWLDWRAPNGKLQERSCRVALLRLHGRGVLSLPECPTDLFSGGERAPSGSCLPELQRVRGSLAKLGEVEIVPVLSRYSQSSSLWNELMGRCSHGEDRALSAGIASRRQPSTAASMASLCRRPASPLPHSEAPRNLFSGCQQALNMQP